MGLFSKETFICTQCGKEFTARFNTSGMCKECTDASIREFQKKTQDNLAITMSIIGYSMYAEKVLNYRQINNEEVLEHRNIIVNKCKFVDDAIQLEYGDATNHTLEAQNASKGRPIVKYTTGGYYCPGFFMPEQFDGTIVDADDVFAVCVTKDTMQSSLLNEAIKVVFFTNDPYIPVFWLLFYGNVPILSLNTKSKKGREAIMEYFSELCTKLTYPVCELKEFKKIIKANDTVKGNVDKKFILEQLSNADSSIGFYDVKKNINRAQYTHYIIGKMGFGVEPSE